MSEPQTEDPSGPSAPRKSIWRLGTPAVVLMCGSLFVISAQNSDGTDLRPGRYTDMASLVQSESNEYDALQTRVSNLTDDIVGLTDSVTDRGVRKAQAKADSFRDSAGLVPRTGPGVVVRMADAPREVIESSEQKPNLLVVHQQDLQSVVNAMWVGGATAITIQGQRVITTTGIKCEGNTVQLQGQVYAQPYEIAAVGDPVSIASALEADPDVSGYRQDSATPDIAVQWDFEPAERVDAPAFDGLLGLSYAEPLG